MSSNTKTGRTVIPFGPQHPVFPEPFHLDLVVEDEKVVEAIPSLGFVHRGLERLAEKMDFAEMPMVSERICGICSFMHGLACCQGIEAIMGIEVPPRARFLRVFWSELSRIHSHLLFLGLAADAIGFESLFTHTWRVRERVLDIAEATTGGRIIYGACQVGGVRRDVDPEVLRGVAGQMAALEADYRPLASVFRHDYTVKHRFAGVGVVPSQEAGLLGAVGPTARGSSIAYDLRQTGYAAYGELEFEPVVEKDGDCYARCLVRVREVFQAVDLLRQAASKLPGGPFATKVKGFPQGEYFSRVEQPRGEVVYYLRGNGTKHLERFRVRTPTFANLALLVRTLPGCDLADVPVIVLSIDPCISCAER